MSIVHESILVIDFGSQYTQLIARRIRELNVFCEIHPYTNIPETLPKLKGVILSGSPNSVFDEQSPSFDFNQWIGKYPILGVCFGAQLLAYQFGGKVVKSDIREYGRAYLDYTDHKSHLFDGISEKSQVWMSHADSIMELPDTFERIASTTTVPIVGYKMKGQPLYGIQFHPEVTHSLEGKKILENYLTTICGCTQDWTPKHFVEETVTDLKKQLGNDKVIMGLSGGVDSTVAAVLISKAIGAQLECVFVDNGLLRKDEYQQVLESYKGMGLNVVGVNAKDLFYKELKGKTEPEAKRKAIGKVFIDVFDAESKKYEGVKWLGQGTIYPDVIESISVKGPSATIKSHHNVGGLPDFMKLKVVEPLKLLFKDEVRRVGTALDISKKILNRHPFPGPGLGIRILGEVTPEAVRILQEVDAIFINGLKEEGLYDDVWQALAVLLPVQSVGVMGDERTYEKVVALRAVGSVDGMTADFSHLPFDFLGRMSNSIINRVKGVNRVVYDISSKPPSTIEWE